MGIRLIIAILATLLASPVPQKVDIGPNDPVACPADIHLAKLVRDSDVILLAHPEVPVEEVRSAIAGSSPRYLEMPLNQVSVLKGESGSRDLVVKFFAEDQPYTPKMQWFLDLSGKPSILFLTWVDEGSRGLFVSHSPNALQPRSPSTVAGIEAELNRQKQILGQWKSDPTLPHYAEIRRLLKRLPTASRERQAAIFRKLEGLGKPAVPALIAQMDDRRPLAHQQISLVNYSPDAFEGIRHYGPKLVVDAIDAILNQIEGQGGTITNGGSERERRNAVAAWRIYDSDRTCRTA